MNQQTILCVVSEDMPTMPEELAWAPVVLCFSLIEAVSCPLEATPWDTPGVEGKGL